MKDVFALLRVHQYIKNSFVLAPLFFAGKITKLFLFERAFLAFLAFCMISSAVYILNDSVDQSADQRHPTKKHRPLASGKISFWQSFFLFFSLLVAGFSLCIFLSAKTFFICLAYFVLNILYSLKLKHVAIIDLAVISLGFVFRLFAGSFSTDVSLSMWIVVMTFLLALFIALAKRREDVLIYLREETKTRAVVDGYNLAFLDASLAMMGGVTIVAYLLYTTSAEVIFRMHSPYVYVSTFFVILGFLRYLQVAFVFEDSGAPTKLMWKDHFLQSCFFAWFLVFVFILYF